MFGCAFAIVGYLLPRLAAVLAWIFTDLVQPKGFGHWVWPLAGLILVPYTLVAYLFCVYMVGGRDLGIWWGLVGVTALFDIGIVGAGAKRRKRR